jgi:hypothetical protein
MILMIVGFGLGLATRHYSQALVEKLKDVEAKISNILK